MDTNRFNAEHAEKSRAVCERIEHEDAERRSKLADLMDAQLKSELGRAKAESDEWRKIAERRLKHTDECEAALAKRNERISKLEKQVSDLRAELANAKVLSERECQILDMWPRYEGGEPVWFGDSVEHDGTMETVQGFKLYRCGPAYLSVVGIDTEKWLRIEDYKSVKRPAPKVLDADGVEIKAGDTVWHEDGSEQLVEEMNRYGVRCFDGDKRRTFDPKYLTHTRPDSWERLEDDVAKEPCFYFGFEDKPCDDGAGCPANKLGNCSKLKASDIIRRAKALVGVEVGE